MNTVAVQSNLANLEHAFFVAEKLGVARLLDPEGKSVNGVMYDSFKLHLRANALSTCMVDINSAALFRC